MLYQQNQLDVDIVQTILGCLQVNPQDRPTVKQLLLHRLVSETPADITQGISYEMDFILSL